MNYREIVLHTRNRNLTERDQYLNAAMGLSGEAGEVVDLIKKAVFHGHVLDREKVLLELGDLRYYMEWLLMLYDSSTQEIEELNSRKLMKRYPNGFSTNASIERIDTNAATTEPTARYETNSPLASGITTEI